MVLAAILTEIQLNSRKSTENCLNCIALVSQPWQGFIPGNGWDFAGLC